MPLAPRPPSDAPLGEDAAVILVGHGSARNPHARKPTERLAAALRATGRFAEVHACFWKEPPSLAATVKAVQAATVYVVPNFAGDGYFTREAIPAALKNAPFPDRLRLCRPVGAHPRMEDIIRRRAADAIRRAGVPPEEVALLLVGHGSSRPGGAAATARALAARLRAGCGCATAEACFLEEAPLVREWPRLIAAPVVVVLPLLIADGLHGSEDLPPLFGLSPETVTGAATPLLGPLVVEGRTVWYWRGVGSDPEVCSVILELIDDAGRDTSAWGRARGG